MEKNSNYVIVGSDNNVTKKRRRSGISLILDTSDEIDESFYLQNKLKPQGTPRHEPLTFFQKLICCYK